VCPEVSTEPQAPGSPVTSTYQTGLDSQRPLHLVVKPATVDGFRSRPGKNQIPEGPIRAVAHARRGRSVARSTLTRPAPATVTRRIGCHHRRPRRAVMDHRTPRPALGQPHNPGCRLLDWESWGNAPAGYDAALLHGVSLMQLDIAERVSTTFADILTDRDGTWRRASRPGRPGDGGEFTQPCTNSASSTATKSTRSCSGLDVSTGRYSSSVYCGRWLSRWAEKDVVMPKLRAREALP
jgi:hypothetical protein